MALSASVLSRQAPADWSLEEVLFFWRTGESSLKGTEEDRVNLEACAGYMKKLSSLGVQTRSQAATFLTDQLCQSLDDSCGLACDVRRHLLDLLGVQWRRQVWSLAEIAIWERRPVEPTVTEGGDELWQAEVDELWDMMLALGVAEYYKCLSDAATYMLLAIATARNLLYYVCDADLDKVGVPIAVRKLLRTECLSRLVLDADSKPAGPKLSKEGFAYTKTPMEIFKEQVQKLREHLVENGNEYPKQHDVLCEGARKDGTNSTITSTLGGFVSKQRNLHKKGKLDQERIDLLSALPEWSFNPKADRWKEMHDSALDLLTSRQASSLQGHAVEYPSKSSLQPFQRKLGQWLANQRQELGSSARLSAERVAMLQNLPCWSMYVKRGAPYKERTGGQGKVTCRDSGPDVGDGGAKLPARGSGEEKLCQPLRKRLRTKTCVASLQAAVAG